MKKTIFSALFCAALASCGNNASENTGKDLYDTSAKATSPDPINRDSITAAMAKDSAAAKKDSAKQKMSAPPAATGGGVPSGTIDSGMTNAGAKKKLHGKKK